MDGKKKVEEAFNFAILFCKKIGAKTPRHINQYYCSSFAQAMQFKLGGECEIKTESDFDFTKDLTPHAWVYYKGKYYDAETQDGVETPLDLPIFKRASV